ncbi:MAG: hypothetical protein C0591_08805 [Marinilabiliales bacterium]|nr:MAG: hypothetical protein C0591_08805 [Marinilabiliales bacterium]
MEHDKNNAMEAPPKGRLILGGIVFISGFLSPLLIPLVIASDLNTGTKSLISGLLALGIPELFMIIAAAILGKPGFAYIKSKIFSWFKKYGPPDFVGPTRYKIGLVMFCLPLIIGFLWPYIELYMPFVVNYSLWIYIGGDVMLFLSLFVLGGNFWDKLRSLFIYKSRAVMINDRSHNTNQHD